jgi:molybdenum cofactor guanylyltransferase
MTEQECSNTRVIGASRVSGILLAGGASRRMGGVNKALLKVGKLRVVERVADTLSRVFSEVIVVTNTPDDFRFLSLPMFGDIKPGYGSLGGLYTGLRVCTGDYGFVAACDMPFLNEENIMRMVALIEDYDVIIPKISQHWEPLHAIYSKRCIPRIEELLAAGDLKMINLFSDVKVRDVPAEELRRCDPELLFTVNLNTPEDLKRAQAMAEVRDRIREQRPGQI